jgi:hypothetical protein
MALTFGAVSSDAVNIGTGASISNLNPLTYVAWVYPTSVATSAGLLFMQKGRAASGGTRRAFSFAAAGNFLRFVADRATTDTDYIASSLALTDNTWHCIAATFSSAASAGEVVNLYCGMLTTEMAETTYSTTTDGSGAVGDDSGLAMKIGNDGAAASTSAFKGRIACAAIFNRVLTLGELQTWQFRPRVLSGCVGFWAFGYNGTSTQPDWSGNGNAGTVTGATLSDHVPLRGLRRRRSGLYVPYTATAAAAVYQRLYGVNQSIHRASTY